MRRSTATEAGGAGSGSGSASSARESATLAILARAHASAAGCSAAAVFRVGADGSARLAALERLDGAGGGAAGPMGAGVGWVEWAAEAAASARAAGETVVRAGVVDDAAGATGRLIASPLVGVGEAELAAVGFAPEADGVGLGERVARFEAATAVYAAKPWRERAERESASADRLALAVELALAAAGRARMAAAAQALVSEAASRFNADRVSIGMLRRGEVRVVAISGIEKFSRRMGLVRDLSAAMEESADQGEPASWPREAWADEGTIDRAARELSERHGPSSVLSVPIEDERGPVGAVVVERPAGMGFGGEEVEALRLGLRVVASRLGDLWARDRWIGARAASGAASGLAWLVGPRHTLLKAAALVVAACLAAGAVVPVGEHASGPAVVQNTALRVVSAPFAGYLSSVDVRTGEEVVAGETVLGRLDDSEVRLSLAAARSELSAARARADAARSAGRAAEARIAETEADAARARIGLLESRRGRAVMRAPVDGVVVSAPESGAVGSAVERGAQLFAVAPAEGVRVALFVDGSRVSEVESGMGGSFVSAGRPGEPVGIEVERVDALPAEEGSGGVVRDGLGGRYRVLAKPVGPAGWLRLGMEGRGRVRTGSGSALAVWTRDAVDAVRLRVWGW